MASPKSSQVHKIKEPPLSEQRYSNLFNYALDILCISDNQGRFEGVNPAFERTLGYPEEEIVGCTILDFVLPDDLPKTKVEIADRVNSTGESPPLAARFRRRDGTSIWLEWVIFPDSKSDVIYLVGHDITERRNAEEQRIQLEKERITRIETQKLLDAKNTFISIASHELKTPLTSLNLYTQMIARIIEKGKIGSFPQAEVENLSRLAQQQITRMSALITELLDVSQIGLGHMPLKLSIFDLAKLINDVLLGLKLDIEKARCRLEVEIKKPLVVNWDRLKIGQVITNLITNAIKFGPGKPIQVAAKKENDFIILKVKDQGIGIHPDDQVRIFDRFTRAVSIKTYAGLGLGLYLVRELIKAHGGNIRVESDVGKGASFIAEIPCTPTSSK